MDSAKIRVDIWHYSNNAILFRSDAERSKNDSSPFSKYVNK